MNIPEKPKNSELRIRFKAGVVRGVQFLSRVLVLMVSFIFLLTMALATVWIFIPRKYFRDGFFIKEFLDELRAVFVSSFVLAILIIIYPVCIGDIPIADYMRLLAGNNSAGEGIIANIFGAAISTFLFTVLVYYLSLTFLSVLYKLLSTYNNWSEEVEAWEKSKNKDKFAENSDKQEIDNCDYLEDDEYLSRKIGSLEMI